MEQTEQTKKWAYPDPLEGPAILAAVKGDQDSFAFLYHLHRHNVYVYCYAEVGDYNTAEDLTQEVFLTMHKKLHTFRFEAALSTWLRRVTINVVRMHRRAQRCKPKVVMSLDECISEEDLTDVKWEPGALDPNLEYLPEREALRKAMEVVDPEKLEAFLLNQAGFECQEISAQLGKSLPTIKTRVLRGRRQLQAAISLEFAFAR